MAYAATWLGSITAAFGSASAGTFGASAGGIVGRVRKVILTSTLDNSVAINLSLSGSDDHLIMRPGTQLELDLSDLQTSIPGLRLRHLGVAPTAGALYVSCIGQN